MRIILSTFSRELNQKENTAQYFRTFAWCSADITLSMAKTKIVDVGIGGSGLIVYFCRIIKNIQNYGTSSRF
jgi:glucose-6-phosphate isomerase